MATFTYTPIVAMTGCATTINQNTLTVAASAAGSWAVAIGAVLSHANIPAGTTIIGYNSTTQAVMSANATATGSALTITATNPTPINIDKITSLLKTGGDVYNISGTTLVIDQDSRYGLNQAAGTSLGGMTISATLGGTITVDGRYIRLIPFDNGSGTVPVSNTMITQGSAEGKLIGVWSTLNAAPVAAGGVMPTTGFIKIKQWNSIEYTATAISGLTANATGPSVVGWLELVGDDASTVTTNRLGLFEMKGEWYSVGTCTGTNIDTYQIPTSGSLCYFPGVWIETDVSDAYEFYPCMGTSTALAATIATDAVRGKVCWISTAGLLRFQHDGTNSTGGYLPPNGRKIRIPNIFAYCCTTAARTANVLPNATLATRYDFTTTGGGVQTFDKVSMNWYLSATQAYSIAITNSCFMSAIYLAEIASPMTFNNVALGFGDSVAAVGLTMSLCFAGGTFTDCKWGALSLASTGRYGGNFADIDGFNFIRNSFRCILFRGHASTGNLTVARMSNCYFEDTILGNGQSVMATITNVEFKNTLYYDHSATTTTTGFAHYIFNITTKSDTVLIDGVSFGGLFGCAPYSGILSIGSAGCSNIKMRNIGTYDNPLSAGGEIDRNSTWTRASAVATVTTADAHNLKVNDIVYILVTSDAGAITLGAKTVTVIDSPTAFKFVCTNGGGTSGTISYQLQIMGVIFALGTGAAALNIEIKRVYMQQTRTGIYSVDNSSKNIVIENVWGSRFQGLASSMLNGHQKGLTATNALAVQTGTYGTHWLDTYCHSATTSMDSQSWTRVAAVCTVTSVDHRLLTGTIINVTTSSATAAIRQTQFSITALTKDTFSIPCINAGALSGTLTYVPCNGRLSLMMNEATAQTTNVYTIDSGAPGFTSAGGLFMPNIGDQVTFTTDYYVIGHKSFPIVEAVLGTGTIANYDITYAIDNGTGFGSFHNIYYARTGASGSSGAYTFTVADTTGVEVGDYFWGTNTGPNAKVIEINGNTITTDVANLGTISGTIRFNHLPSETITNPETGFKMKWRFKTAIKNLTIISSLYIWTFSTDAERAYMYPLDIITATIKLTGLVDGTEVGIYRTSDKYEYFHTDSVIGGEISYSYGYTSKIPIYIVIHHKEYEYIKIDAELTENNLTAPIQQRRDRWYSNPA